MSKTEKNLKKETDKPDPLKETNGERRKSQIPLNVNYYRHLLEGNTITEQDINWVLKLRESTDTRYQKLPDAPYQVYNKFTESIKEKHVKTISDLILKNNSGCFEHLIRRRTGPTASPATVNFEISLRGFTQDSSMKDRERKWTSVALKDKMDYPKSYPGYQEEKEQYKKLRKGDMKELNLGTAHDGRQRYPNYEIKYKDQNFNNVKHMKGHQIEIGMIKWANSLR